MSEKKESGRRPPIRPSLKGSIPIEIYLKRKEKLRQAALLQKQKLMPNKMKEDNKRYEAIEKSTNDDNPIGDVANDIVNDRGSQPGPEGGQVFLPRGPYLSRSQRPKRPRGSPYPPQRPQYCDFNNNIPTDPQRVVPGRYPPAPPVQYNAPQNPMTGPRFN